MPRAEKREVGRLCFKESLIQTPSFGDLLRRHTATLDGCLISPTRHVKRPAAIAVGPFFLSFEPSVA